MTNKKTRSSGFTIIEALIVLAIAGAIILVVLLAVPALRRTQRNTQRKQDVSSIMAGVTEYVNNNSGTLPPDKASFSGNYKISYFTDSDVTYAKNASAFVAVPGTPNTSGVYVETFAKCNGNTLESTAANVTSRSVAALYWIEVASGAPTLQCQDI